MMSNTRSEPSASRMAFSFSNSRSRIWPSRVSWVIRFQMKHLELLAVAVDAPHALLQPVGVPRDVVVDHQRAELQVDALAGRLGGHHDLGTIPELVLGQRCGHPC